MNTLTPKGIRIKTNSNSLLHRLKRDWQLLLILLPGLMFYAIFRYAPMYGIVIAFKDYNAFKGIMQSPWTGLKHFTDFFSGIDFWILLRNTTLLGFYTLIFSFPLPIIFSILLNEVRCTRFKKLVQTSSFLPSLLSVVVVCSMVTDMLSPNSGIINKIISMFGFEKQYFMILPQWFRTIYISSTIWQYTGYDAVIFIAAIAGVPTEQYEAAKIDGCGRLRAIWNVTLPAIMPTISIMMILKSGQLFRVGFTKILLLYNPAVYEVADVFATFVYRKGILEANYSYSTAVGLFESIVSAAILIVTNRISKKVNQTGLW